MYSTYMQAYMLLIDTATTHQIVCAPTMKQAEEIMGPFRTALSRAKGPMIRYMVQGSKMTGNLTQKTVASINQERCGEFRNK